MRKKLAFLWTVLSVLFFLVPVAGAYSLDDIEFWAGEGQYELGVVIDFNDGTGRDAFVWGYRYDEVLKTDGIAGSPFDDYGVGELFHDATQAIVNKDSGLTGRWRGGAIDVSTGYYLDAFTKLEGFEYDGHSGYLIEDMTGGFENMMNWSTTKWAPYFSMADELTDSASWTELVLSNTYHIDTPKWIGWSYGKKTFFGPDIPPPNGPMISAPGSAPVPEPGTFLLLGIGLLGMAARGRNRKII